MKRLLIALLLSLTLLVASVGTALAAKNTIRLIGKDGEIKKCKVLPHAAHHGAATAAAHSKVVTLTHPGDPCPVVIILDGG